MRRLLAWLLVTVGVAVLVRKLRSRRRAAAPEHARQAPEPDHAEELRRKLAESRGDEGATAAPTPETSVEERRAEVHAEGRAAVEEMRSTGDG